MSDTDDARQDQDPAQEQEMSDIDIGQPGDAAGYAPSAVEVTRGRMQGLGMRASDLDAQRDPTAANSSEQYGAPEGSRTDTPDQGKK